MDKSTLIGFVTAFGLVFGAIAMGGAVGAFVDVQSLLIVVGGTIGAAMINYPLRDIAGSVKIAKQAFFEKSLSPDSLVSTLVEYSSTARKEGILALESSANEQKDEFLKKGLQLAVDGQNMEAIEEILGTEIEKIRQRHQLGAEIFSTLGSFAPALGLIGTLIGLVQMLRSMDDPSSIGPAMAVALLTTLYGSILANLVFNPIAGKLRTRNKEEVLTKELIITALLSITSGDNPRIIEQRLHSFLKPDERSSQFA